MLTTTLLASAPRLNSQAAGLPEVTLMDLPLKTMSLADERDGLRVVDRSFVHFERVEVVVDVAQLLERAELRQLGGELRAVGRIERVLMLKLADQELQKGILAQVVRTAGRLREEPWNSPRFR